MRRNLFVAIVLVITALLLGKGRVAATLGSACLVDTDCSGYPREACLPAAGNIPITCQLRVTACQYVSADLQDPKRKECDNCIFDKNGTWTALGCIENDPATFVPRLIGLGVGIAGGIAFLLILFGGFQILISAGNPEQMNAGKEIITSAVAGLLLIVFSIFLLRLIGYNILGIPGFG
jgi:hypothetical protein